MTQNRLIVHMIIRKPSGLPAAPIRLAAPRHCPSRCVNGSGFRASAQSGLHRRHRPSQAP